jgi:hypothetical protein
MTNVATIEIAREVRQTLAGSALTERQAKLYSQRLRRDMGREGLASFSPGDVETYLDEAMLLLQCGQLERDADSTSDWRNGIKRAAEILEWLSQTSLKPPGAPLHLLAAAAYQLADYPAMALGHLRRVPEDQPFSNVLREILRANFPATLGAIREFWRDHRAFEVADRFDPADLTTHTFQHVVTPHTIGSVDGDNISYYYKRGGMPRRTTSEALDLLMKEGVVTLPPEKDGRPAEPIAAVLPDLPEEERNLVERRLQFIRGVTVHGWTPPVVSMGRGRHLACRKAVLADGQ